MTDETQNTEENEVLDAAADVDEPVAEGSDAAEYLEQLRELQEEKERLVEELQAVAAERDAARAEADEHRPTVDVSAILKGRDGILERFGMERIRDLAQMERVKTNRERSKNGHFPLPPLEGEELEKAIEATIADLLGDAERAMPANNGPLDRVLKMVDEQGNIRQIPYEPQINNMAGSLADGYERYRLKGFKLPKPMLCATKDCYLEAKVDAKGDYEHRGYCSADHERRTERDQDVTALPGITNRNILTGAR